MITAQWLSQQMPDLSSITVFPEGGQKWVFGATHALDGDVVIKLIKPNIDMERVSREILAVGQVKSPRVPPILEVGILTGTPAGTDLIWLREKRICGENVRQLLDKGALDKDDVLTLGLHVLEALANVAQARIVHRDVKPENIIRCTDGSFWLLDFGIARHLDLASITATAALGGPGTLGYAPPEQFRNKKRELDGRADLFALAVTLVECIAGKHPYRDGARDASEVVRRIEGTPLPIPKITWDTGGRLTDFIATMGQRRIDCRPCNAAEALEWLREIHAALGA
jgi:serine/threonine protein kinase